MGIMYLVFFNLLCCFRKCEKLFIKNYLFSLISLNSNCCKYLNMLIDSAIIVENGSFSWEEKAEPSLNKFVLKLFLFIYSQFIII